MNFVVSIEHPAWAHQFRSIIKTLEQRGHKVKVFAVKKDMDLELLDKFGIKYEKVADSTGNNIIEKAWLLFIITVRIFFKSLSFKPDIFIGRASPMMALNSFFFGKPHIIFEDTDHSHISLFFCKFFSALIITPVSFRTDLGKKQKKFPVYKELFYLHPSSFTPDESILTELGVNKGECFTVMRFVSWKADHDMGQKGLSNKNKLAAVKEFEKFGKVFITSEEPLKNDLEPYRIQIAAEKMHHVLYFASLLYGESSTMASECAVLGTHAIFCDFAGRGYTDEQEKRFDLVYNFKLDEQSQKDSIHKGIELLSDPLLWQKGKEKRKKLLNEMRDGTELFLEQLDLYMNK